MAAERESRVTEAAAAHALDFERPVIDLERKIEELVRVSGDAPALRPQIRLLEERARELQQEIFADLSAWQKVQLSRHPARPYTLDYIERLIEGFVELHGDRRFGDDPAIVAGFGTFEGTPVLVLGHQKGRSTKEKVQRNFGQPKPEGYRKAMRLMELAARMHRPVVCLIDTQGAYPGIDAEERGQAEAIAKNLEVMAGLPVPIVCAVIGEGGSGGALALGVANRILMMEYATYSVISPEGCASILWRDDAKKPEAAEAMKMTAADLLRLGIIDEIIPEAPGGAHRDHDLSARHLGDALRRHLADLLLQSPEWLRQDRYRKFRGMGAYIESGGKDGRSDVSGEARPEGAKGDSKPGEKPASPPAAE
jgi:acetyl-CoA carboxylase carboxyl transferase subunit alpha